MTEVGKNVTAATSEFTRTVTLVRQLIAQAQPICVPAFTTDNIFNNKKVGLFFRVPRGVVLAIAPYNYPLNLAISKIIPALLTGNTVVFKPATNGSLLGTLLGNIFYHSGFAPGVINVVVGRGHDIGHALTTHPEIDVIGFTGSFAVGQQLLVNHPQAHIFLELGGKDVAIVLKDANLSLASECIVNGALSFSGQRCTAIKLVVCEESVADQLIILLKQKLAKLTVGSARNNAFITPLINQKSADYVSALINDAVEHGARVVMGHQQEKNLV